MSIKQLYNNSVSRLVGMTFLAGVKQYLYKPRMWGQGTNIMYITVETRIYLRGGGGGLACCGEVERR